MLTAEEKQVRVVREILNEIEALQAERRERAKGVLGVTRQWFQNAIRARRITQMEAAVISGKSPTTIRAILRGRNVRVATLAEVADALGYQLKLTFEPVS